MKAKLLKKIRKQYSIVYYPKGSYNDNLEGNTPFNHYRVSSRFRFRFSYETSKNDCLDWIVKDVKRRFGKKQKDQGVKVWYNH